MRQFIISYNNYFQVLHDLSMRCSASGMFAPSLHPLMAIVVGHESDDVVCIVDWMSLLILLHIVSLALQ